MRCHLPKLVFALVLAATCVALAQQPDSAFLPQTFAGWEKAADDRAGTDPAIVDQANPAVLKEYGFQGFETATYKKEDRILKLKAARFQDATGAYGAFTFYRTSQMLTERIGTMAASANERVLFFRDNILIDAVFDRVTAMSAGELRDLAAALPSAKGTAANLPTLPNYLPREQLLTNSVKYVVGPIAFQSINAPLAAEQIDFSVSPEVILAQYNVDRNSAQMVLVGYPTPQIAGEKLKAIEAAKPGHEGTTIVAKRTGPLLAVVEGTVSEGEAKTIAARVHYEADVTWNENTGLSKRDNIGNLIVAAFMLIGIILLISLGTGVLFGFFRVALARLFPGRYAKKAEEADFIRLHLE